MTVNSNGNKMAVANAGIGAHSKNTRMNVEMAKPYNPFDVTSFQGLCLTSIEDIPEAKRKMNNTVKGTRRKDKSMFK